LSNKTFTPMRFLFFYQTCQRTDYSSDVTVGRDGEERIALFGEVAELLDIRYLKWTAEVDISNQTESG